MSTLQTPVRLRWVPAPETPVEGPADSAPRERITRIGWEPGRARAEARRETPEQAGKHSLLIRRCLSEPEGEFDRCLSIALDRMIDAAQAELRRERETR